MDEIQFEGLRESTLHVHTLMKSAVSEVGGKNVILWGLSQGCSVALISLLLWNGPSFAATIGMCGWLPLRKRMLEAVTQDASSAGGDKLPIAIRCIKDTLDIRASDQDADKLCKEVPIFLGHGVQDEKVSVDLGRQADDFLRSVGLSVQWHEYDALAHWYSGEMLRDIVNFIAERFALNRT